MQAIYHESQMLRWAKMARNNGKCLIWERMRNDDEQWTSRRASFHCKKCYSCRTILQAQCASAVGEVKWTVMIHILVKKFLFCDFCHLVRISPSEIFIFLCSLRIWMTTKFIWAIIKLIRKFPKFSKFPEGNNNAVIVVASMVIQASKNMPKEEMWGLNGY